FDMSKKFCGCADSLSVDRDDDVSGAAVCALENERALPPADDTRTAEPGAFGRSARFQAGDSQPPVSLRDVMDADIAADDASVLDQFGNDAADQVDGDRESDARTLSQAARVTGGDRRVHADQASARIEQRPARTARVDRCVNLNNRLDDPVLLH